MFDANKLETVPKLPGVYLWKDAYNNILYIGKAKNLNNRMNQYFLIHSANSYMTSSLVNEISGFQYVITKDEKDALILESNLIKKHKPRYNIMLIDDKTHRFIRIKLEKNKIDIKMVRKFRKDKCSYYGPFPLKHNTANLVNLLNSIANFQYGLPIRNKNEKYWKSKYEFCQNVLNPNNKKFQRIIKQKMYIAAEQQNYELAEMYKNIFKALEFYLPKTIVELNVNINQDIWGVYKKDSYYSIYVMFYRRGKLLSIFETIIKDRMPDTLTNYIKQFYQANIIPNEIHIDSSYLRAVESNIKIVNPKISKGKKVIDMATKNAKDNFFNKLKAFKQNEDKSSEAIKKLGILLNIKTPKYIIMIDNSVTNNDEPVSGLVVYRNGIKQRHEYRKYNLISRDRKADVDYMQQIFLRYWSKNKNNLPDLLILDGGKPQVSEINKIIKENNINLNMIGLVKDDDHSTRAIINKKYKEIKIDDSFLMNFLAGMQIEVDRFAKHHHSRRRRISSMEGKLLNIKGIGQKTEENLIIHFETYSAIYNASMEELEKVVSHKIALQIKRHL